MFCKLLVSVSLLAALGAPLVAQGPAPKPAAGRDPAAQFVGLWEGSFQADHGPGGYRLEIAHDTAWTVTTDFVMDQTMSSRGAKVKIDGNTLTWEQELMGQSCRSSATLDPDGAALKGETVCEHGQITFSLRKK